MKPISFIGEPIEAGFAQAPFTEKRPTCPDYFVWHGERYPIVELVSEWRDYTRRGRFARNMQPQHAAVAAQRGSFGVGRFYFQVRVQGGRLFELYFDRAPKGGGWFLVRELEMPNGE